MKTANRLISTTVMNMKIKNTKSLTSINKMPKSVDSVTQMMNSGGQLADAVLNAIDAGEADDLALQTLDELKEAGKQFSNLNVLLDISRGYLTQAGKELEQSKKVLAGTQSLNDSVKNQLREFKIVVITYEIGNTSDEIERLRNIYKPGIKVRLIHMEGEPQMTEGLEGAIDYIDDAPQIHVKWENGSSLALIPELDKFEIIKK